MLLTLVSASRRFSRLQYHPLRVVIPRVLANFSGSPSVPFDDWPKSPMLASQTPRYRPCSECFNADLLLLSCLLANGLTLAL